MGNFQEDVTKTLQWVINEIKCLKKQSCCSTSGSSGINVRAISLGVFADDTAINTFLQTYLLTVASGEVVILSITKSGLREDRFFTLGEGIYPNVGTAIVWEDLPLNYKESTGGNGGVSGLQETLDFQNFAYGQNLRLKNASNSDSEIELNVNDFFEPYLRVTNYNDAGFNTYIKPRHIEFVEGEDGRKCNINFANAGIGDLLPVINPVVTLTIGQNSGYIATQEETQTLLDLKADLVGGLVPSSQLPPAVDEILEYTNSSFFPVTGISNKYYLDLTTNKTYRWSGSVYVPINEGIALGETSSTAYRGDRGKIAYDHTLIITGNPHGTTTLDIGLSNVDDTSDANKPVSTAQATAIGLKQDILISGTNIKSINGDSILGSGNLTLLSTIAGLNISVLINDAGYITNSALSGYLLSSTASTTYQPLDTDLTNIAALSAASGFLKTNGAGIWSVDTSNYLTSISGFNISLLINNSGYLTNATGVTTVNGNSGAITGIAITAGNLSQFAATSSAQLASLINDETGTGLLVFNNAPTLVNPTTDRITISGNVSSTAWTTTGLRIKGVPSILTDTTSSGTVTSAYTNALGANTIAATNVVTFTEYITAFYREPVAGTNVTFTNKYALGAESLKIGTSNSLTISASGVLTAVNPIVGTQTANDNSTKAASTAYVDALRPLGGLTFAGTFALDLTGGKIYNNYTQTGNLTLATSSSVLLGNAEVLITANGNTLTAGAGWINIGSESLSAVNGAVNRVWVYYNGIETRYTVKVN